MQSKTIFQWDLDTTIAANAPFVHFASIGSEDALVVKTVDGMAAIPNQLTTIAKDIQAWTMEDGKVCDTCRIHVIKRAKPSDFIYTETEIENLEKINQRVNELLKKIENIEVGSFTLPTASETTLGGIKVGRNLTISADGVLDAPYSAKGEKGDKGEKGEKGDKGEAGLNGKDAVNKTWDTLEGKPFTSLGNGLTVNEGILSAVASGGASADSDWELIESIKPGNATVVIKKEPSNGSSWSDYKKLLVYFTNIDGSKCSGAYVNMYLNSASNQEITNFPNLLQNGQISKFKCFLYEIDSYSFRESIVYAKDTYGFLTAGNVENVMPSNTIFFKKSYTDYPVGFKEIAIAFIGSGTTDFVAPEGNLMVHIMGVRK